MRKSIIVVLLIMSFVLLFNPIAYVNSTIINDEIDKSY